MKKNLVCCISILIFMHAVNAQLFTGDKMKVQDYLQNQQFEEAISYLAPLAASDSTNMQWLGFIAYASYMNENIPDAKKYYQKIIALDSNNLAANQYLAVINGNNNPVAAQAYTHRLLTLQPGKAAYYRNMGELLKKTNQADSALIYYTRAYQLAPNDYKNAAGLAEIMIGKKNYAAADSLLTIALARDPLNITCLKLRIRSAYEAKDYPNAVLPGEALVRVEEISLSALTQLALSYYNLKLYNDCIRICDFMLRHDLDIESVYYYEAKSYAKIKEYIKSNDLLQTCLTKAISKTAEMYYYNLGENYEALHQFAIAVKQYDSAYYLFRDPLMKYYAGRICETNLHNEKLAKKYYTEYLQLAKPLSAEEKKAYEYVKTKWGRRGKAAARR